MASFGGSIKLTGADEYRNALKQITQSLRETGSELTAVASRYDQNDKSLETLNKKTNEMSAVLSRQTKAYDDLKAAVDSFSAKVSGQAQEHNKLVQTYETEKQKLEEIKRVSGETSKEYQDQQARVTELAGAVAKSSQNMSENEAALSRMKTQLNQTETTVNKTTKEIDELGNETEESGEKAKKGSEGYTVFKNILANLGTQAINSALRGLKSLGGAVLNVGKQAIDSYAQYEQLTGGVETLFKDSSDIVMDYAKNAYVTAGMSANQYMETVTSFSASLLQSLGGDTEKAAEVGDMAISDMSDNANKMGTSMEMIQNAYQGFAKQNYTMLDNLKLGYGGTKSEMERLLKDAEKISGIHYDISSLSDVYNAVHVIQQEMGITGTTSEEAANTISGSAGSMKAAWQNMITGMADDSANFDDLTRNLVNSVVGFSKNILPRVQTAIKGMATMVTSLLKELVPQIIETIPPLITETMPILIEAVQTVIQSILDVLPEITTTLSQLIPDIVLMLVSMLPQLIDVGVQVIVNLVNGIVEAIPKLAAEMPKIVITIINTLIENIPLLLNAAIQLLMAIVEAIPVIIEQLVDNLPSIVDTIITTLLDNMPMLLEACIKLFMALVEAIPKVIIELVKVVPTIVTSTVKSLWDNRYRVLEAGKNMLLAVRDGIVNNLSMLMEKVKEIPGKIKDWFVEGLTKIKEIGTNIVEGIWEGISDGYEWIKNKIKGWVGNVLDFFKKLLGINSPSKVMENQVGKYMAEGIGVGFTDEMQNVEKEMQNAIPTSFDTDLNINSSVNAGATSYDNMVVAFKEALSDMKIELDDEVAGKFVERTVARAIYN